jgi:phosphate transport system ATP-binding protein
MVTGTSVKNKVNGGTMALQEQSATLRIEAPVVKRDGAMPKISVPEISSPIIQIKDLNFYYGSKHALKSITVDISEKKATAFIGPSGCGKTTLLRCLNRMNDLIANVRVTGSITLEGKDIYGPSTDVIQLRRRVGMIFQKWNPFPKSIYENVVYGLRIVGINDRQHLDEVVESTLKERKVRDEEIEEKRKRGDK